MSILQPWESLVLSYNYLMGHENCVFLLCIIREKHYNKQRMSSSIPDVKKLYTTISSWEHTVMNMDYKSEHIKKSIWKKR